ncbi:tryptophan-rich sensory protein [Candidatus Woesebacteria bacterium]|nr:tryptophan-rich sensory protein [Candidatus Woesebacteria bacterium]
MFFWPWNKPKDNYWFLLLFIVLAQSAGLLGSLFTFSAIPTWYATLDKPFFSPPNYLFGPVWTTLYTLMGISAYLVYRRFQFGKKAKIFWQLYWAQLVLNTLWSILFFGFKEPGLAFVEIVALWYFIVRTIQESKKLNKNAAYLLYPYLAWVSFAALLNLAIYLLN